MVSVARFVLQYSSSHAFFIYISGKTQTRLRERINNHRSECRTGRTSDVFDKHCHECGANRGKEVELNFRVKAFMKLNTPDKLLTYEKLFHERQYATINQ